ncbi:hypothetical protein [Pseudomonas baltica]|uniref:hypothetical protein n=1 Tax=Pseudomonas baltica TaxID=2762576 RepID=UPI00289CD9BD|nr:hypothetical protein [Pseudomonas baltica]
MTVLLKSPAGPSVGVSGEGRRSRRRKRRWAKAAGNDWQSPGNTIAQSTDLFLLLWVWPFYTDNEAGRARRRSR